MQSAQNTSHTQLNGVHTAPTRPQSIWHLRESIGSAMFANGYCFMYDVTLPFDRFYELVLQMRRQLANVDGFGDASTAVTGFGHLGDANLHLNILCEEYTERLAAAIEPAVYAFVRAAGGSVSAEHGIGFLKSKYLAHSRSAAAIAEMRAVKRLMDPNGVLNPYKVLPEE